MGRGGEEREAKKGRDGGGEEKEGKVEGVVMLYRP